MAFDWIAGLFQSEQTRGLSGDGASAVALDESNPYYNYRLRRHRTDGDLIDEPDHLWHTSPFVADRAGLGSHIAAERGEGVAGFTDVLVILSDEDWARANALGLDSWVDRARSVLLESFEDFCRQEQFARLYSHRPLKLKFVREGSEAMGGQTLGLGPGEFITGLLPNLYTGPVDGSFPVIGVHLNLPGVWDGYREVGRLYNDQILFTLGNHWLDNFAHPSLQEAALYRLQQYPDGSFVHIVNPDLQDRYQVTSVQQGGTNVLTLATREGHPLAYMVLALVEAPEEPAPEPKKPGIAMPVAPSAPERPESPPSVAPPMLIDDVLQPVDTPPAQQRGNKTIIPDAPSERIFTLSERGALLQKVHFSAFMAGYDVYISQRGELGTVVENPAAAFQVRKREVSLKAHIDLLLGGRKVSAGDEIIIDGDTTLEIGGERLEYRDLRGMKVDGWPYVGEIRRPASSTYLIWGESYQIGRSRECRVVLPDEPRNDNIHWKASVGDGATIRARTGEIPKSRFYTDSIMVASEHATIDTASDRPEVVCNARHCYVYVRRDGDVLPLYPSTSGRSPQQMPLEPGDEILIGNCLFQAGFTSGADEQHVEPAAPAPEVRLTPDSLLDAVSEPDFETVDPPSIAPPAMLDDFDTPDEPPPIAPPAMLDDEPEEEPVDDSFDAFDAGPTPLTPIDQPVPLQGVGMESVLGADLRAVSDDDLAGPDETGEEVNDDPTRPGMVIPRALLDDDGDGEEDALHDAEDALLDAEDAVAEPLVDPLADAVQDWDDEDDWDEVTGPPSVPSSPGETDAVDSVPSPFPDLSDSLSDDDEVSKQTWNDEYPDDLADDPTEAQAPLLEEPVLPPTPVLEDKPLPALPPLDEPSLPALADLDDEAEPTEMAERPSTPTPLPTRTPPPVPPSRVAPPTPPSQAEPAPSFDEPGPAGTTAPDEAAPTQIDAAPELDEPAPTEHIQRRPVHEVVFTDDDEAQFELGRPLHIVLAGWTIKGEVVAGNHTGADLIVPENRIVPEQSFQVRNYFRMKVRGRRGHIDLLSPSELLIDEADPTADRYDNLADITIDVVRRDDEGEEDFVVRLIVTEDRSLPDPRARFVALDYEDPLAAALVTRGLGVDQPRSLELGGVTMNLLWSGETLTISDYLETYRTSEGFQPFFVQHGNQRFVTAPENGEPIVLQPGDRFVVGTSVYLVRGL